MGKSFHVLKEPERTRSLELPVLSGENTHYRFHFHMDKCIGCHACEVACSEQNGLPVHTQWRRVGEVQSGRFPDTQKFFISSGCNHCLEPSCLSGCPVNAYEKKENGVVVHLDNQCIGCGYCTWNCPYGVPVFQEDRNIVTKCDLCYHRLEDGRLPSCAEACPVGAIGIEAVSVDEIRRTANEVGKGPDMPSPSMTVPSTKMTLPKGMDLHAFTKSDDAVLRLEDAHTPLIALTVLSQLGFGGFVTVFLVDLRRLWTGVQGEESALGWVSPALLTIVGLSMTASLLHLGRPVFALRAVLNWKTSWLSREIIGLSAFAGAASVYSIFLLLTEGMQLVPSEGLGGDGMRVALGVLTVLSGGLGIYSSSKLYRVPARPSWNSVKTTIDFFEVGLILGPAFFAVAASLALLISPEAGWLRQTVQFCFPVIIFAFVQKSAKNAYYVRKWLEGDDRELKKSAVLRLRHFDRFRLVRNLLGTAASALCVFLFVQPKGGAGLLVTASVVFSLLVTVSVMNRYLFFVTVVPRNIPGNIMTTLPGDTEKIAA